MLGRVVKRLLGQNECEPADRGNCGVKFTRSECLILFFAKHIHDKMPGETHSLREVTLYRLWVFDAALAIVNM